MKSVLLVRHAKSSWELDVPDFDRPLNHRGEKDAPQMAKRLLKQKIKIDALISSPAKRALTTASIFADIYGIKEKKIIICKRLYEPAPDAFAETIEEQDNGFKTIAIFSHNPGITGFANTLTGTTIDDMPTCSIFGVKADIKKWKDFAASEKEFWFFDYPKAH